MKTVSLLLFFFTLGTLCFSQAQEFQLQESILIGPTREYENLQDYFAEERSNVHVILEAGTYYNEGELWISGENIIIEGLGKVNVYCTTLYDNVMWISADNVKIINLHMKHFKPGGFEDQNCSGRVIGFDYANNCTIEKCDLNGCGLAGLHDNGGNENILVKDCYIHNNSVGAYTDIDGGIWLKAIDEHPVFKFENNRIENNGPDRIPETD